MTVRPQFNAGTLSGSETVCYGGDPAEISPSAPSGGDGTYVYQWQSKTGSGSFSNITTNGTGATYNPPSGLTVTTTYQRLVKDEVCQTEWANTSGTYTVTVQTPSVGTVTASASPATICSGSESSLSVSATGNNGTMSYAWSTGGTGTSISVSPTVNTTYIVTATATTAAGCTAKTTKTVAVAVETPSVGTVTASASPATICSGSESSLSVSATGNNGTMSYAWSTGGTGTSISVSPTVNTTYTVTATATTAAGCTAKTTKTVAVAVETPSVGTVTASASPATICSGSESSLSVSATGNNGTMSYAWSTGGTGTSISVSPTVNTTYTVTATATTAAGCTAKTTKTVAVAVESPAVGTVTASADPSTICIGKPTTLSVETTGNSGEMSYVWSSGSTIVSPNVTTTYTVTATATTGVGCTASTTSTVSVNLSSPEIANVSDGDMVWSGNANTTTWTTAGNWIIYDGSNFQVASSAPTSSNNVYLVSYGEGCSNGNPVLNGNAATKDLTINAGHELDLLSYTLSIAGNFANNGTFDTENGSVIFNGSETTQVISGSSLTFNNVTFDNAKNFTLDGIVPIVNGTATFSAGIVTGDMTFGASATAENSSRTSHVDGTVTKQVGRSVSSFTFPTGNAGVLGSIEANVGSTTTVRFRNVSVVGELPADYPTWWNPNNNCDGNDPMFDHVSNLEYWNVTTTTGLANATLKVSAENANAHFNSAATSHEGSDIFGAIWLGGCWQNIGGEAFF